MNIYDMAMPVMELILDNEIATMALFTAYIDNRLGYEIFCSELPKEYFTLLKADLQKSDGLRDALLDSLVLDCGIETYFQKAFESYDMWCCLLDCTETVVNDPHLMSRLFSSDRCFVERVFFLWKSSMMNEEKWCDELERFRDEGGLW